MRLIKDRVAFLLRDRMGIPGLLAICALVFAMVGGAYAAKGGGLTSKQKKEVTKIAKKYAGKPGPQGPAGPTGPAGKDGANGKDGTSGTSGTNGTNGTSATVASFVGSKGTCTKGQGGLEVKSASAPAFVCNGEPWTAGGTLPSGETQTGAWAAAGTSADGELPGAWASIPFTIPLSAPLGASEVHFQADPDFATTCTGTLQNPTAPDGHLCVYAALQGLAPGFLGAIIKPGSPPESGATVAGASLNFKVLGASGFGTGTWAVTAE
jgi:hypothetical protein